VFLSHDDVSGMTDKLHLTLQEEDAVEHNALQHWQGLKRE